MIRHLSLPLAAILSVACISQGSAQTEPKFLRKTADEWAALLKSPEAAARRNAAFALGQLGDFAVLSLPKLKQALRQEKDPKAREGLVAALGQVASGAKAPDAEMEKLLLEALRDPDKYVRRSAALALGLTSTKSEAALEGLTGALADPAQEVRQNAAWALGQLDERSIPALRQALRDPKTDSLAKRDAAVALFAVAKVKPEAMRPAMDDLLGLCRDPNPEVRKAGLVPLIKIVTPKDAAALPVLKATLADPDAEVRQYAALALSNVGGQEAAGAVPILVDALRHGEPNLKRSAAVALHNIGKAAAPAVPDLIKSLREPDAELRKGAALALGGIGPDAADAVPWLVQLLTDVQQPIDVRIQSAEALTGMKGIPAVQQKIAQILAVLGSATEDGDLRVRLAWLLNDFIRHQPTMQAAGPVLAKVCAEPATRDNGSARYHCAWLLGIVFRQEAPDSALNVLSEWLKDSSGKLYFGQRSDVSAVGSEQKGDTKVASVLQGDSRIMAVDALRLIGPDRVGRRKDIVQQLRALAADKGTNADLRADAQKLLTALGQ
jgi:HEAT repeat protein